MNIRVIVQDVLWSSISDTITYMQSSNLLLNAAISSFVTSHSSMLIQWEPSISNYIVFIAFEAASFLYPVNHFHIAWWTATIHGTSENLSLLHIKFKVVKVLSVFENLSFFEIFRCSPVPEKFFQRGRRNIMESFQNYNLFSRKLLGGPRSHFWTLNRFNKRM